MGQENEDLLLDKTDLLPLDFWEVIPLSGENLEVIPLSGENLDLLCVYIPLEDLEGKLPPAPHTEENIRIQSLLTSELVALRSLFLSAPEI